MSTFCGPRLFIGVLGLPEPRSAAKDLLRKPQVHGIKAEWPSFPQPSPPSAGGEGEACFAFDYDFSPDRPRRRLNWMLDSGVTDKREFFTMGISRRILSALIALRLTGFGKVLTGARSTADQSPSV